MSIRLREVAFSADYDTPERSRAILKRLATQKWGRRLIALPNGLIRDVDFFRYSTEKFKSLFNTTEGPDVTKPEWVEAHVIDFLEAGLANGWITPNDIPAVYKLAQRVGAVFPFKNSPSQDSNPDKHAILKDLVDRIEKQIVHLEAHQDGSLVKAFFMEFPERAFDKYCKQHENNALSAYKKEISFLQQETHILWDKIKQQIFELIVSDPFHARTFLNAAILRGNTKLCNRLIKVGVDLNSHYDKQELPLLVAIHCGQLDVIKSLIARGAKVDIPQKNNVTVLHYGAQKGDMAILTEIVNAAADINLKDKDELSPLHYAVYKGSIEAVRFLLDRGADIHACDNNKTTSLSYAALRGDLAITRLLIERGAEVNSKNTTMNTPLHLAAMKGHVAVLDFLIEQGAEINSLNIKKSQPIHLAALEGKESAICYLLEKGADINCLNELMNTPLQLACSKGKLETVALLIAKGADTNLGNTLDQASLHFAIQYGQVEVVKQLLDTKADLYQGQVWNALMLSKALRQKNHAIINELIIAKDPETAAYAKEGLRRKSIAHVANLGGKSQIIQSNSKNRVIDLAFFSSTYFWKKIAKNIPKFASLYEKMPAKLAQLIAETAFFAANRYEHSAEEFYERWQQGLPVFFNGGTLEHHIGMLIWNDVLVFCDGTRKNYSAVTFDKTCMTSQVLENLWEEQSVEAKKRYLQEDFMKAIKAYKTDLSEMIKTIPIDIQTVDNCTWFNSNPLILPFCILYHTKNQTNDAKTLSFSEAKTFVEEQQSIARDWLSYYQAYLIGKYLRALEEKKNKYPPDIALLLKAFKACYPKNIDKQPPLLKQMWSNVNTLFCRHVPLLQRLEFAVNQNVMKPLGL